MKFSQRKNYFLYVYNPDTRKVGYASLGSAELDRCKERWLDTYAAYIRRGGSTTKVKKTIITKKLKEYIDYQFERSQRGEIKERSFNTFHERVRNRIIPYVKDQKIQSIQELTRKSYRDFPTYWKEKGYDATTINDALSTFNNFFDWLVEDELLDLGKKPVIKKLQQYKDYKRQSNPAFTGEDWTKFKDYLYRYEMLDESHTDDLEEKEKWWYRRLFVCWVLYQFASGNRPHETTALTFGDVSVKEYTLPNGKKTLQGIQNISRDTKKGARTSIFNGHMITRIMQHINSHSHRRSGKYSTTDTTPLFLNPYTGKSIHNETLRHHFRNVLRLSGLEGKGYTPYSLRSTYITNMLLRGTSIEDIARNCGNSPEMIRRHYDGVENILKSDELLKLNKHYYSDDNLEK